MLDRDNVLNMWWAIDADEAQKLDAIRARARQGREALRVLWSTFHPDEPFPNTTGETEAIAPAPDDHAADSKGSEEAAPASPHSAIESRRSLSAAVRDAIENFYGTPFTTPDVLAYINGHFPYLNAGQRRDQISSLLSKLVQKQRILVIEDAGAGKAHKYQEAGEDTSTTTMHFTATAAN
jgi:hypothetical protein